MPDFASFTTNELLHLGLAVLLAAIPAVIWFGILFRGRKTSRGTLILAFFFGTLTVLPLTALQYLWIWFPQFDIYRAIERNIAEVHLAAFATLVVVGILEEFAKSLVVRVIDKTRIGIQTVNDAVRYAVLAGLGFAFTENILYFFFIWQNSGFGGLIFPVIFRSIFTVCAHMVFSGIFGYYYGVSKFSKPIMETKLWMGERARGIQLASSVLGVDEANAHRQLVLLKGLLISMLIHAFFNLFLEFELFLPVVFIVVGGFLYLLYLMAHKAGAIAFSGLDRSSTMAKKDQDVVLELLGMWSREGRYKDVIDICQRLLMRDPDNKVVQLFQAKAMDEQKLSNLENSFFSLFKAHPDSEEDRSMRSLVRQKVLMEMLKEKQGAPLPTQNIQTIKPSVPTPGAQTNPSSQPSSPGASPATDTPPPSA